MQPDSDDRKAAGILQEGRRPMALAALFVLVGGTACPAGSPSPAPSQTNDTTGQPVWSFTGILNSSESWKQFKTFWEQIDRNAGPLFYLQHGLAQRFGMQETTFQEALRQTEQRATGAPPDSSKAAALALGDYALASLAQFRIHISTFERQAIPTRMMMPPPSTHVVRQLRDMGTIDQRVDQLRELKRRNTIDTETFLVTLDGLRTEVYHHCVLRTAALAHMRSHPTSPVETPSDSPRSEDLALLSAFYQHPDDGVVGSPAWFQSYEEAVLRLVEEIERSTDPKLRSRGADLRQRHQALVASLQRLDAFKPRLEALFADLEKK